MTVTPSFAALEILFTCSLHVFVLCCTHTKHLVVQPQKNMKYKRLIHTPKKTGLPAVIHKPRVRAPKKTRLPSFICKPHVRTPKKKGLQNLTTGDWKVVREANDTINLFRCDKCNVDKMWCQGKLCIDGTVGSPYFRHSLHPLWRVGRFVIRSKEAMRRFVAQCDVELVQEFAQAVNPTYEVIPFGGTRIVVDDHGKQVHLVAKIVKQADVYAVEPGQCTC